MLPQVECDQGLIKQVFANLISNAVKYTLFREHAVIEVGQTTIDDETVIFIRDNGAGFDMKQAGKLFGAFQRLHRQEEFEGTGVGLATVRRIVKDMEGGFGQKRKWAKAPHSILPWDQGSRVWRQRTPVRPSATAEAFAKRYCGRSRRTTKSLFINQ